MTDVVVFGASGYSGLELLRILARHPVVRVVAASSDRWAGEAVSDRVRGWPTDLRFIAHGEALTGVQPGQIALLATPARISADLAPPLLDAGARIVDLSGAFRLPDPQIFADWYGFEHPAPQLLPEAVYGLPELFEVPREARLVANPGCYATAAILAAAPLVRHHLVPSGAPLFMDGKSGATGAGRALKDDLLFSEVAEGLRPYRVAAHQHTPEIERALGGLVGRAVPVSFTAHLVPMRRGLLVSVYAPLKAGTTPADVEGAYRETLGGRPFMSWVDRPPQTLSVRDDNFAEVHAAIDARTQSVCAFCAIDNLVKGAAGQAVQNLNTLLGLPDTTGLLPEA